MRGWPTWYDNKGNPASLTKAGRTDLTGLVQSGQLLVGECDVAGFGDPGKALKPSRVLMRFLRGLSLAGVSIGRL